jgi:hypothetical protein
MIEFQEWPKIPRLNRDITITEKIDGTNAAVGILSGNEADTAGLSEDASKGRYLARTVNGTFVYAQSRKCIITPDQDNHGFAKWVWNHAEELASILGPGLHFGEWWGNGIKRGYGLAQGDKRFSLFNTAKWNDETLGKREGFLLTPVGLGVVPVLYEGPFDDGWVVPPWNDALYDLATDGSKAAPGFNRPEGIVIYHHAANSCFKVTLEHDESPKEVLRQRALKDFRESERASVARIFDVPSVFTVAA